jgi:hypothetical protein
LNARIINSERLPTGVINTRPSEIEETILTAFGHAIVEFEDTLYVKFQLLTKGIGLTEKEFVDQLEKMEKQSIVSYGVFLGRRCWAMGSDASTIWDY